MIALSYWIAIHAIAPEDLGAKLFQTVGSLAVGFLGSYLKKAGLSRQRFHGKQHSNFKRFENIAADSFHGGLFPAFVLSRQGPPLRCRFVGGLRNRHGPPTST